MIKKSIFLIIFLAIVACNPNVSSFAQENDLEFNVDINSPTTPLPDIYKPNIDLSGQGFFTRDWPQSLSAAEVLETWKKDIGFSGLYRLQYNLWEISEAKNKDDKKKLLDAYEAIIKNVSDSGGIIIVDIYGMPAGMGRILDKKSILVDSEAFKKSIKETIRELSCNKKYNIWYEVWNAPDLSDFFLGRQQDYFNLYRSVALAIKELEKETGRHIPIGGPSVSWWFQGLEPNTVLTPERSLIYGLIRYCYSNKLPLDFISWHAYSTDPLAEQETTLYHKYAADLVRDWLTYFRFDRNIPLIVDEWNFDRDFNILSERRERANVTASYILARIKGMRELGVVNQTYFSLQDFENKKEPVIRNVGVFDSSGKPKATYNVYRMLASLDKNMLGVKSNDEFCGILATKAEDKVTMIIYNYVDPAVARSYLSRNIVALTASERKILVNIIKTDKLSQIMSGTLDPASLHLTKKLSELIDSARQINESAKKYLAQNRNVKINIRNLKNKYTYQLYSIDSNCSNSCVFTPREEKEIPAQDYSDTLILSPYSVNMIVLKIKPEEPAPSEAAKSTKEPAGLKPAKGQENNNA